MLHCDEYLTPTALEEAFELMRTRRDRFRIVAGATDTLPWAREGRAGDVDIPALIDVTGIPELSARSVEGGRVRIGAATPIQRFLDDPALSRALPAMPRCAVWFADDQIRESATVGGNIVNASPAADLTPPLLAQAGEVELAARRNGTVTRRRMPLHAFVRGPGQTALEPGEILVAIECDSLAGYGGSFEKVGHRRSLVISLVCVTALVKLDAGGTRFEDVRLAVGGIGPVPHRLANIEAFLRGGPISAERLEGAAEMPLDLVQSRTRQPYRRDVVRGLLLRGLLNAIRRVGVDPRALAPELEASYA